MLVGYLGTEDEDVVLASLELDEPVSPAPPPVRESPARLSTSSVPPVPPSAPLSAPRDVIQRVQGARRPRAHRSTPDRDRPSRVRGIFRGAGTILPATTTIGAALRRRAGWSGRGRGGRGVQFPAEPSAAARHRWRRGRCRRLRLLEPGPLVDGPPPFDGGPTHRAVSIDSRSSAPRPARGSHTINPANVKTSRPPSPCIISPAPSAYCAIPLPPPRQRDTVSRYESQSVQ